MILLLKFNLVLLILFALGIAAAGHFSRDLLLRNAQQEVMERAQLLMDNAIAVRSYTAKEIKPLLAGRQDTVFQPQMVSAYSANVVLGNLRELNAEYRDYGYKEAALNPTNPRDRAADWEEDIINQFRSGAVQKRVAGLRETPTGTSLFVAQPLVIKDPGCLQCHSSADAAPAPMTRIYGNQNGFNWKLDDVIGAQFVSVPLAVASARAERTYRAFLGSLVAVLLVLAVALNLLLWWMFIEPVTRIAALADRISLGAMNSPDFATDRRDEIGTLAASLSRMRRSLIQALRMLET